MPFQRLSVSLYKLLFVSFAHEKVNLIIKMVLFFFLIKCKRIRLQKLRGILIFTNCVYFALHIAAQRDRRLIFAVQNVRIVSDVYVLF